MFDGDILKCLHIGLVARSDYIYEYFRGFSRKDFTPYSDDAQILTEYGDWAAKISESLGNNNNYLRLYTGNFHSQVNLYLRDKNTFIEKNPQYVVKQTIEVEAGLRSMLISAPRLVGNHILFRFVGAEEMLRIISTFIYADFYVDRAFLSSTWNLRCCTYRSHFVLRLFVPDGTRAMYMNASSIAGDDDEFEIILPPSRLFLLRKPYLGRYGVYVDCFLGN